MDDLTPNMTKRRHAGKNLWYGETACPHANRTGRLETDIGRGLERCAPLGHAQRLSNRLAGNM
jgi:hypothetical protein